MKKIYVSFLFVVAAFSMWFYSPSFKPAAPVVSTETFWEKVPTARVPAAEASCTELIKELFQPSKSLKGTSLTKVRKLLEKLDIAEDKIKGVKTYSDAIDVAYTKINARGKSSLAKSDKMANFGKDLREIYAASRMAKNEIKDLDYLLAKSVMMSEMFDAKEFKVVEENAFALGRNTSLLHIDYKKYKEYALSFESQSSPYIDLDRSGGTIIGRTDIREMEAHNLFPVYIPHDMKHVVYALLHERYFPMLFGAARSKNHKRYVMMGALGEGADTVQYSEESAICEYFKDVKNLDLEEAVMWIGRASNKELDEVAEATGYKSDFENLAANFKNWAPPASAAYPAKGKAGIGLNNELDAMIEHLRKQQQDADLIERYKARESQIRY